MKSNWTLILILLTLGSCLAESDSRASSAGEQGNVHPRESLHAQHGHSHSQEAQKAEEAMKASTEPAKQPVRGHEHVGIDASLLASLAEQYNMYLGEWVKSVQPRLADASKWVQAFLAVLSISLAPTLFMLVLPFDHVGKPSAFLRLSLAFASGSLLGDAFLHLIPRAFAETKSQLLRDSAGKLVHDHEVAEQASVRVGVFILLGILLFLVIERLIRLLGNFGERGNWKEKVSERNSNGTLSTVDDASEASKYSLRKRGATPRTPASASASKSRRAVLSKESRTSAKAKAATDGNVNKLTVTALLNLLADLSHNFTDGLAIGGAFSASVTLGLSTTASMFLHELPHELGDMAILVHGGLSKWKACAFQLATAMGAFAGCGAALALEDTCFGELILPLTAGGFIYVSTAGVLPELLSTARQSHSGLTWRRRRLFSALAAFAEMLFALSGVAIMYVMRALDTHAQ